ncbi:hybrid sensor histidine kinase/response regulator [Pseudorhodoferax soli]|uniref:histidine kinase n=1 Tax=Pseudorhodoferax soli TaxID=545864 RepID=A0A368XXR1_9BURK|nr:PAS-domain containing protein [Pseudorhodoferax soli]RCW72655.1 phospho-acceptor domain-containing protein [Pseudorhodoferax soli]
MPTHEPSSDASAPLARYLTLQAGLDLLDRGLSIFDRDLRLVAWNRAYLKLLDFPEAMGYVGAPFESFIAYNAQRGDYGPGNAAALVAERVAAARAFRAHEIERTRPGGQVLRIRGEPVPGHGFVTLYSDVTAERHAEATIRAHTEQLEARVAERTAELQRSEHRMRLVMDSIPAAVGFFDAGRTYRYLNRAYHDWFRVDTSAPDRASARAFLGDAVYAGVRPRVLRALRGQAQSFEYELQTAHGERRIVRTSLVPERARDGSVSGCFELTFDITEERRAQVLLARAHKLESLTHLTGGLAHDFNNILTVVIGNLDALARSQPEDAATQEYVLPALGAARRGADLVKGLMSFARRQPLEAHSVSVGALLATVAGLVRRVLPEALQLEIDTGSEPLWTWIDPTLLEQALINMVLNARDACESLGPQARIRLRACATRIDAAAAAPLQLSPGDAIRIDVQDNGIGMDAHTLAHLFEPFFTTKRGGRGTGLGMAVVYGFIKQSGGAVDARSAPGEGTTVSVWLPAAQAPAEAPRQERPAARAAPRQRGLALLVDDDAQVRRVVRRNLLELGYVVLEAEHLAEARKLLAATPDIALVLTDLVMAGPLDGVQLARAARDSRCAKAVVIMTGNVPDDWPRDAGSPLLRKPFTTEQLAAAIEQGKT